GDHAGVDAAGDRHDGAAAAERADRGGRAGGETGRERVARGGVEMQGVGGEGRRRGERHVALLVGGRRRRRAGRGAQESGGRVTVAASGSGRVRGRAAIRGTAWGSTGPRRWKPPANVRASPPPASVSAARVYASYEPASPLG